MKLSRRGFMQGAAGATAAAPFAAEAMTQQVKSLAGAAPFGGIGATAADGRAVLGEMQSAWSKVHADQSVVAAQRSSRRFQRSLQHRREMVAAMLIGMRSVAVPAKYRAMAEWDRQQMREAGVLEKLARSTIGAVAERFGLNPENFTNYPSNIWEDEA